MATVAVPANTTVTLDPGTAYQLVVVNSGTELLILDGKLSTPGHRRIIYPTANEPVTVVSTTQNAGQVDVSVYGAATSSPVSQPTVGTLASQPAASTFGKGFYFATDDSGGTLYYSNATAWTKQAPGVSQAATPALIATQTIASNFQIPASVGANTPSDVTGLSITFTAVAGATYLIRLKGSITIATSGHQGLFGIRNAANTLLDYSGTGLAPASSWTTVPMVLETYDTPGAGSVTYKAFIGYDATSALGSSTLIAGAGFTPRITALRVA